MRHEMFADELYPWAVLQHISLADLPQHTTLDGNPIIYFLFLWPFVKLGLPPFFYSILNWLFSAGAVFLLWKFSPFTSATKLIITASAPFFYWFPVVARNYSMLPPVLFAMCALLPKIQQKNNDIYTLAFCILAGMTANIHFIFDMAGGSIFILFLWNKFLKNRDFSKINIISALIFAILLIIPAVQTFIASSVEIPYAKGMPVADVIRKFGLSAIDAGFSDLIGPFRDMPYYLPGLAYFHFFIILCLMIMLFLCGKQFFFFFFAGLFFHIIIYLFKYGVFYPYRTYCVHLLIISGFWGAMQSSSFIKKKNAALLNRISSILICLLFLMTIPSGFDIAAKDWNYNFASEKETADFINNNIPSYNTKIFQVRPDHTATISAYLKGRDLLDLEGIPSNYFAVYKKWPYGDAKLPLPGNGEMFYILVPGHLPQNYEEMLIFCS